MCPKNSDTEWRTEIAHEGHQGQVRTKQLLRAPVWFPGMDSQCDKFLSTFIACQANTPQTHPEPLKMTDLPEGPWDKVSVDFCGPMASGDFALVFYCQYARYPVVEFVGSTSEKATIPMFRRVFDTHGVPKEIKSDNGPPFNNHMFEEYTQEEGLKHRKVTPGWAEANGDVERFMQRIKKTARTAVLEGKPMRDEVHRGIRVYRATEHATTGASPNRLMFGRELRGKFPEVKGQSKHKDDARIRCRDREHKQKMKKYADKRRHTAVVKIKVGDTVLCNQERKKILTPLYVPDPMVVIGVKGSMVTTKNSTRIRTRNYADWKLLKNGCRESPPCDDSDVEPEVVTIDSPCEPPQGPEQSRADLGEDTVPADKSSELQQGHEQPGTNSDAGEYVSRQRAGQPEPDRNPERRHGSWDRPRRETRSTKDTIYEDFLCE